MLGSITDTKGANLGRRVSNQPGGAWSLVREKVCKNTAATLHTPAVTEASAQC